MKTQDESKRRFIKTVAYAAPVVLTMKALPAFASSGSAKGNNGVGNGHDRRHDRHPPVNDGPGTSPGNPGNRHGGKPGDRRWW